MQITFQDRISSLRDLANRWGVSLDTVRRLVAAGELRIVRISPGRIGVRASEEERYLRARESKGVTERAA